MAKPALLVRDETKTRESRTWSTRGGMRCRSAIGRCARRMISPIFSSGFRLVMRRQRGSCSRSMSPRCGSSSGGSCLACCGRDSIRSIFSRVFGEVFSVGCETRPTEFEDSRHLVAFLARAAKNKVIDEYRRAASLKQDMHREEPLWGDGRRPKEVADPIDSPSELAQAREVFGRLRELLPEERRTILELKAEGLSSKDIGERLGISERTVQRVLEDLRRRMESEWESGG